MLNVRTTLEGAHEVFEHKCFACSMDFNHTPFRFEGRVFCSPGCANDWKRYYG